MKESMGNAFVLSLIAAFSLLIMLILTYAINYSRANKVKNKILNYIASYAEVNTTVDSSGTLQPIDLTSRTGVELADQIDRELSEIGYRGNYGGWNQNSCPERNNGQVLNSHSNYHYCVYAYKSERGYYYGVTTFMYFDIPVIGASLELPVYGETRVIYDLGDTGGRKDTED